MAESQNTSKKKDAEKEKNTATLSKISNAIKGSEKLDVEGTDLLELLSHLEGELQARDVAIAALKSEQTKRLLYGCSAGSDQPASPLTALHRDKNTRDDANTIEEEARGSTCFAESQIAALQDVIEKQKVSAQKMAACLRESEQQRARILEELEDEKAKHERDTAQGDDITYELEKERIRLKEDLDTEVAEKQKLEVALKESLNTLEEEKSKQKQIVLVLLADRKKLMKLYLEEKKRSEDLAGMLQDEKGKMDTMAAGLEEESKRSLAMEAELEKHINQFGSERQQLRDKLVTDERRHRDLEDALRKARGDVEHFKKQLSEAHRIAMSQQGGPPPYPGPGGGPQSVSPVPPITQSQYANFPGPGHPAPPAPGPGYTGLSGPAVSGPVSGVVTKSVPGPGPVSQRPPGMAPVTRPPGPQPVSQPGPGAHQAHKFHNPTSGGFGHASHPALIQAGVSAANISHLDQESLPNSDINAYSQIGVTKPSTTVKSSQSGPGPGSVARKPLVDSASSANRKPALGKGVPPPVPPNKPVVPVKKDLTGKRSDSVVDTSTKSGGSSVVAGLQGLKFGISLSNSDSSKGIKPLSDSNVPAKKFYNNIESKS